MCKHFTLSTSWITNNNLKIWGQIWNQILQRNMKYNKDTRKLKTTYVSWVVWPPMFAQSITPQYSVSLSRILLYFNRIMINYCMNCNSGSPWKQDKQFHTSRELLLMIYLPISFHLKLIYQNITNSCRTIWVTMIKWYLKNKKW